jgi:hypothetical protein
LLSMAFVVRMVRLQVLSLVLKLRKMYWGRLLGAAPFHLKENNERKASIKRWAKATERTKGFKVSLLRERL